jgi:hypothetical protein
LLKTARLVLPFLLIIAAVGVTAHLFVTEHGIGITPDSVGYIRAARSLRDGQGFRAAGPDGESVPLTHWPPLFPAVLSLLAGLGLDPIVGARWLNAILFGGNILLVGVIVRWYARGCSWAPILGSLLAMVSIVMYRIHTQALSEPLFVLLVTFGLFLLARHDERPSPRLLIGASVALSLGFLTKYAGLAYVLTSIVWLLLRDRKTVFRKFRDTIVLASISLTPAALWMLRNLASSGSIANREFAFHPVGQEFISSLATTLTRWALPYAALAFLLAATVMWRRATWTRLGSILRSVRPGTIHLFGLSILVYGLVVVASMTFADVATSPDSRILLPAYVSSLILTVCFGSAVVRDSRNPRLLRFLPIVLFTFLGVSYCARSARWIGEHRHDGQGYTMRSWRDSPTIAAVASLPSRTLIYTHGQDAVYILTGRDSGRIPHKTFPTSGLANAEYETELERMLDRLHAEDGVVVYFDRISRESYPAREELAARLGLQLASRTDDGWIYKVGVP